MAFFDDATVENQEHPELNLKTLVHFLTPSAYEVKTRADHPEFDSSEYVVHRRKQDFEFLQQKLEQEHPFCIIPPIAFDSSKTGLPFTSTSPDQSLPLNTFLQRVIAHPILVQSSHLKQFLVAKTWELVGTSGPKLIDNAPGHFGYTFSHALMDKLSMVMKGSPLSTKSPQNPALCSLWNYATMMEDKLKSLFTIVRSLNKTMAEYQEALHWQKVNYVLWSSAESGELHTLLTIRSQALESIENEHKALVDEYYKDLEFPLYELQLYANQFKETLKKYTSLEDSLFKSRESGSSENITGICSYGGNANLEELKTSFTSLLKSIRPFGVTRKTSDAAVDTAPVAPHDSDKALQLLLAEGSFAKTALEKGLHQILLNLAATQAYFYSQCQRTWETTKEKMEPVVPINIDTPTIKKEIS